MRLSVFHRSFPMLVVALAAGLCAAWAAQRYLQQQVSTIEAQARVAMVERIVANQDLPAGTVLRPELLAFRNFPVDYVASDSVPMERLHDVVGMTLAAPLLAGDAVLSAHLEASRMISLSQQLSTGRRAITLPVDALNSQSGLLQPGDLIDLYVSFDYQRRRLTAPLLQGVMVLATGSSTDAQNLDHTAEQDYSTITLDAAPEDAIKLVAARESGVITAVLRSPQDTGSTQVAARGDLAGLLGVAKQSASASGKARVIYGNQAVRNLPALVAPRSETAQHKGLFQLPYVPPLSSQWMHTAQAQASVSSTAGLEENEVPGPVFPHAAED
ncbi:Flp pilus assembly protein CpaB [Allopusillimonas ginsengisoli]|uniref:Flp pilus assembly protein CpaB n=1 Tax=Allopusillimonas ginsengisoli TaxID=453575 RepID=UPI001020947A|nr:Flp pilus assembly protein CpaB [Allopusillimonas ginsengisoli]TEA77268.1 Flp pilus assembly protein CpaB [Allopusillimonas ginsengisoli]